MSNPSKHCQVNPIAPTIEPTTIMVSVNRTARRARWKLASDVFWPGNVGAIGICASTQHHHARQGDKSI
jgi:hypothetical protein